MRSVVNRRGGISRWYHGAKRARRGPPAGVSVTLKPRLRPSGRGFSCEPAGPLEEDLREGPLARRVPRRWRQGDPYLGARPRERAARPSPTTGASWASSKIISDSESFVRSLARSLVRAGFHVLRLVFSGPYECHRVRFLRAERGGPSSPSPAGPLFVRAELTIGRAWMRARARSARGGTIEINCEPRREEERSLFSWIDTHFVFRDSRPVDGSLL